MRFRWRSYGGARKALRACLVISADSTPIQKMSRRWARAAAPARLAASLRTRRYAARDWWKTEMACQPRFPVSRQSPRPGHPRQRRSPAPAARCCDRHLRRHQNDGAGLEVGKNIPRHGVLDVSDIRHIIVIHRRCRSPPTRHRHPEQLARIGGKWSFAIKAFAYQFR